MRARRRPTITVGHVNTVHLTITHFHSSDHGETDTGDELFHKREREWGKHHSTSMNSRPRTPTIPNTSTERSRTNSQVARPVSSLSMNSHHTTHSGAHTLARSSDDDDAEEIVHLRERNWNAPHAKWDHNAHAHRPASPLPSTSAIRQRTTSLTPAATPKHVHAPLHRGHSSALLTPGAVVDRSSSPLPDRQKTVKVSAEDTSRHSRHSRTNSSPTPSPKSSSGHAKPNGHTSHIPIKVNSTKRKDILESNTTKFEHTHQETNNNQESIGMFSICHVALHSHNPC